MSQVYQRGPAGVEANLTPMIDVTFLLIVFFVLVSQIVTAEHVDMDLPRPENPATFQLTDDLRVVINLVPGTDGSIESYRVGTRDFSPDEAGRQALINRLIEQYRNNPRLHVNLRADRATHYEWIDPVLMAVSTAAARAGDEQALARINLVVVREN